MADLLCQYPWNAANAVYGEGCDLATAWAEARLDELWDVAVETVLTAL